MHIIVHMVIILVTHIAVVGMYVDLVVDTAGFKTMEYGRVLSPEYSTILHAVARSALV